MRVLVVGATSGIAKECARIWASSGNAHFDLVGRTQGSLDSVSADLRVRNPAVSARVFALDLTDPTQIENLEAELADGAGYDFALIAQGELTDQGQAEKSVIDLHRSVTVNATSVALFAEMAARLMTDTDGGKIGLIGSVAGDRGRRTNYSYGAAKAFIDIYARGMQHRFAGEKYHGKDISVSLIKPGPTATPMTVSIGNQAKMASPAKVAQDIVDGLSAGKPVIYTPGIWRLIMTVVRFIPQKIFNQLDF